MIESQVHLGLLSVAFESSAVEIDWSAEYMFNFSIRAVFGFTLLVAVLLSVFLLARQHPAGHSTSLQADGIYSGNHNRTFSNGLNSLLCQASPGIGLWVDGVDGLVDLESNTRQPGNCDRGTC